MEGIIIEIDRIIRSTFKDLNLMSLLRSIAILAIVGGVFISSAMTQQENKNAWVWSVNTTDLNGQPQAFYMPIEGVTVSWTINSSGQDAFINNASLKTYASGDKGPYRTYWIPPKNSTEFYENDTDISLYLSQEQNEGTDYVEITANAKDETKLINETHIIEIKVKKPGILKIQKETDGWKEDLSGWTFWAEGPKEIPEKNVKQSQITDRFGKAIFTDLRPGTYDLTEVPKEGWVYIAPLKEIKIDSGKTVEKVINNIPNVLTITKVDSENRTMSGWSFIAKGQEGQGTFPIGPTDGSGKATWIGLPVGKYGIEEIAQPGWKLISITPNKVTIKPGENPPVRAKNAKTGTIKIIKMDSEGQPVNGLTFMISGPDRDLNNPTDPTDDNGVITVSNLLPGEYEIEEILPGNLPGSWRAKTDIVQTVNLLPGEVATVRFVNEQLLSMRIIKFEDLNKNGRRDVDARGIPTERGLSDWKFIVEGPEGINKVGTTNAEGIAYVNDLIPGKYIVTEDISKDSKPGWICTTLNPHPVQISSKLPNEVVFGNSVNSLIFKKFNDTNLNRKQDGNEEGLPGWSFNIEGQDGRIITTDPTDIRGITTAVGLMPGRYVVTEVLQNGWINTTSLSVTVDVRVGEDIPVPPFGNVKSSRLEIFKFNDTNRNGIQDSGDGGLPDWNFTVRCPNGSIVTASPTNADGITALEGLTRGDYVITENTVEGWLATTPTTRMVNLSIGAGNRQSFGNYYCLRCHRITDKEKTPNSTDGDVKVIKEVSDLSTENIDRENGNVVDYNITICPSRSIGEIAAIPTDIVIAVDNSPSISNLRESAVGGVHKLAEDIAANDKNHVTRIGLISWSDEKNSGIEVPLIDNYTEVAARASEIKFAEGNFTKYEIGLSKSVQAFGEAGIIGGKEKKIVIITDANDSGYARPNLADMDLSGYSIFAIVVGDNKETNASVMLNDLTRKHKGYVIPLNDLSELGEALVKTATAGSLIKNVHLVEVLPNYLALLNSTATDDQGKVRLNGDSKDWTTTTITWDIGDLSGCWSTDFKAVFCWKLPADVNQPKLNSYVNYTDEMGMSRTLVLPEHEIKIVSGTGNMPVTASKSAAEPKKEAPGFEALFAAIGISAAGYLYRRRGH
jgi:hypothetical protein